MSIYQYGCGFVAYICECDFAGFRALYWCTVRPEAIDVL